MRDFAVKGLVLALSLLPLSGATESLPTFKTPDSADEVLAGSDQPFRLHFDSSHWQLRPQRSQLAALARVIHNDGAVMGAFGYRAEALTPEAVQQREERELASAFAAHTIEGFERRRVNGQEVWLMRATATNAEGSDFVIRSYLWLGPEGTADYGLTVGADRFEQYRGQMLDLLNGLDRASGDATEQEGGA